MGRRIIVLLAILFAFDVLAEEKIFVPMADDVIIIYPEKYKQIRVFDVVIGGNKDRRMERPKKSVLIPEDTDKQCDEQAWLNLEFCKGKKNERSQ